MTPIFLLLHLYLRAILENVTGQFFEKMIFVRFSGAKPQEKRLQRKSLIKLIKENTKEMFMEIDCIGFLVLEPYGNA